MPRASLLAFGVVTSLSASAWGQSTSSSAPPAEEPAPVLTVRAQAPARSASDVTIDTRDVRNVPRTSAAELLTAAPGFFLSQHGGEGKAYQFFLRGFDAEHGQDIEFNVAGLPVNEPSNVHGQGYADLNFIPPEVVDRVRVLSGPFDPRQGDFAVAGSARFDLGVVERGARVGVTYGMFNTARALAILAPRNQARETFIAGDLARSDGFGENRAWSRASLVGQWLLDLGGGTSLRAFASSYAGRWDSAGVVREPDFVAGRQGFFDTNDPHQGGFSSRHAVLAELNAVRGSSRFTFTAFGTLRELRVRENFTGYILDPRGDRYEQTYNAGTVGLTGAFRQGLGFAIGEIGVFARHDITTSAMRRLRANDDVAYKTNVDADVAATNIALYADIDLTLPVRGLRVRGGVRADGLAYQIDDRLPREGMRTAPVPRGRRDAQGFHIGPRATVEYEPIRGISFVAAYGNGFRSPQALSLGDGENAPFAQVHAGEIGARYRNRYGSASLAGFLTHVDHDLVFEPTLGQNIEIPSSAATTRGGLTAYVRMAPIRDLVISMSGTWTRATFDATGFLVPYVPRLVGRLDASFRRDVARWRTHSVTAFGGLGATLLGYRALPYSESADAVGLVDLGGGVRVGPFELEIDVRNLFDARWRDAQFNYPSNFDPSGTASLVPVRQFTAGRPFTLTATLSVYL